MNASNKPAAPNARIAPRLTIGHHWPGVGEPGRLGVRTHHYKNMKTKQLANLLIKILGLSVVVHAIPIIVASLLSMLDSAGLLLGSQGVYAHLLHLLPTLILMGIGIYLIIKSRDVAAFLFKNEEE